MAHFKQTPLSSSKECLRLGQVRNSNAGRDQESSALLHGNPPAPCRLGDTRGPTRSVRAPREADRSPPWRPVITGPGWAQPREPRKKAFCETRHHARSQRRQEPVGPESLRGGIFLSTCVQRQHDGGLDTYLGRPERRAGHLARKTTRGPGPSRLGSPSGFPAD